MFLASAPQQETERLMQLEKYKLSCVATDNTFNHIVRLAKNIFNVSFSALSFTEMDEQRIVAHEGLSLSVVPRSAAVCSHTLYAKEYLYIRSLEEDSRFKDHFLRRDFGIQTYLGVPVFSPENVRLGSLCVMDSNIFEISSREIEILQGLSQQITKLIEERYSKFQYDQSLRILTDSFERSGVCSFAWSLSEEKVFYGVGSKKLFGSDTIESSQDLYRRIHPEDRTKLKELVTEFGKRKEDFEYVLRLRNAEYEWNWVILKGCSDEQEKKLHVTVIDISHQKSLEVDMIQSQKKMHAIFESSHDALTITSEDGRFFDCNSMALKLFGVESREEFSKLHPADLSPVLQPNGQSSMASATEKIRKAFETGSSKFEWIHKKINGEEFPAEVLLSAFEHAGKRFLSASVRNIQRRKDLEELNNHLQSIAMIGAWELDVKENTTRCTAQVHRICGLLPGDKEILTLNDGINYYRPHEQERIAKKIQECVEGTPLDDEFEIIDAKGEEKWVRVIAEPIRNHSGEITIIKGTIQDVTEKKIMELAQERKNAELSRFEEAFNQNLSIIRMNPDREVTSVNELFTLKTQYTKEEVIGKKLIHYADRTEGELIEAAIQEKLKNNELWRGQKKLLRKDGSQYWVDSTIVPIFERGTLKEIISFRLEITTQKKSFILQNKISNLRKKYIECSSNKEEFYDFVLQTLLELSGSKVGFVGERLKNPQGNDYLKVYSASDISWDEESQKLFNKGLEFGNLDALYGSMLKNKKSFFTNSPQTRLLPSGHLELKSFMALPIVFYDTYLGFVGLANHDIGYSEEDIEYLMPIMNVIGEMINNLKVAEELQVQTRLSHHNAKLAMIGELAAGVGHEINNPLLIIQGFKNILHNELFEMNVKGELFDYLNNIDLATKRIANVVKGLRSFSRSDVDEVSLFNLAELIMETTSMLQQIYKTSNVELIDEVTGLEEFIVYGNRGRIQQVLVNLISNAKDASEGKNIRKIEIQTEVVSNNVLVKVTDNGTGVSESLTEKIFEPFFTTKEVNKGTGIGLPMSAAIIRDHQGVLEFENLQEGACFKFSLPLFKLSEKDFMINHKYSRSAVDLDFDIIIAEDEESIGRILKFFLERSGARVRVFRNGVDALKAWQEYPADLIISDLNMPLLSGVEFLKKVRSSHKINQPKFILMSGGDKNNEINQLESMCDGVLLKPFYPDQLCAIVYRVLKGKAA